MSDTKNRPSGHQGSPEWIQDLAGFQRRNWADGIWNIVNTLVPYFAIMATMIYSVRSGWPYWTTLLMALPAVLFLIRNFIIFHDCTHGSFLPSDRANRIVGVFTGALAFTPYEPWRQSHLKHHATNGQLDHRGFGDVVTMTFEEYQAAGRWERLSYRLYRHPLVMFFVGSFYTFLILHRFLGLRGTRAERRSVILSNLIIATIAVLVSVFFGFSTYVAVQLPVIFVAGIFGIWLFYVQHQFDPGYWARDDEWDSVDAALHGASHYKLPAVLRWFTGNIGIHHIHHLRPRIPNYLLHKAYKAVPETHVEQPLTFWKSLGAIRYNLWSEANSKFLSFRQAARIMREQSGATTQ